MFVDPAGTPEIGSVTATLYDVPSDATTAVTPTQAGATATLTSTAPGQNFAFTFSGTIGQRISATLSRTGLPSGYLVYLKNPDGSTRTGPFGTPPFVDAVSLIQNGTHTLFIDPAGTPETGSVTATLYDVPADATGELIIGGPSVTLTTTTPGQNFLFTFNGTLGQNLTGTFSRTGLPSGYLFTVKNPDGSTLYGPVGTPTTATFTLTQSGVHSIIADSSGTPETGSITGALALTGGAAASPLVATLDVAAGTGGTGGAQARLATLGLSRSAAPAPLAPPSFSPPRDPQEWVPGPDAREHWRAGRADSPWRTLPNLQADPGVTALAGQVLALNGEPLAGVSIEIDGRVTETDADGHFLLTGITAGHHELEVDAGARRDGPGAPHGIFTIGVDIREGQTNQLPFTIWLPKLDTAHTVNTSSPTTAEVVLTTPHIPGLEVRIPAGTAITDEDGNPVTELGITAIPLDRPPFPLPDFEEIPIFFTVQPGNAYLSKAARIIYPNYTHLPPGTRAKFWEYDPEGRGWFVYGRGTVSADGEQVVPDPGVGVYRFAGAMFSTDQNAPSFWDALGNFFKGGDPVDLGSGLFEVDKTDLAIPDVAPLALTRTYRQLDPYNRPFGIGTNHSYGMFLWSATPASYQEVDLILPNGTRVHYVRTSPGTGNVDAVLTHTSSPTAFYGSTVSWNGNGWDLRVRDGTKLVFTETGAFQRLARIEDRYGNRTQLYRDPSGRILTIRSPNGHWIALSYDASNRITLAADNSGRTVGYTYNAAGYLWKVTDAAGKVTEYTYDASNRLRTIKDPRLITFLTVDYDANSRVQKQTQADNTFFQFAYTLDQNGKVTQTDVTDPRGFVRRVTFNSAGYALTDTAAFGQPEAQTTSYDLDPTSNLVLNVTDPLGHVTHNTYDTFGNVLTTTSLYGTPDAVTTTFTYEPAFNQLASVKDPLNHTTSWGFDSSGNRHTKTDALQHTSTFNYFPSGQLQTATSALQKTTTLTYESGDLVSVTDPLGRVATRFADAVGRPVAVTDPLGNRTRTSYDTLNRVNNVTDPLGGVTAFTYDENGNRLTVKDAKLNTTTYTYNNLDQVATRKDALLKTETYTYDANGNLLTVTDRKGQVTEFRYDSLDRRSFAGFGRTGTPPNYSYQSSISYTYDAGNLLRTAADTTSGNITRDYWPIGTLKSETTAQGVVNYQYDAASRRTQFQVAGQTAVVYGYDDANRLLSVTQGSTIVGFGYDDADRRNSLTLPGNLSVVYGYDDASQLLSLTYKRSGATIGDLAYIYDQSGRRATTSGSYARLNLPAAVSSAIYNANNQLTKWSNTNITCDLNGNMNGDGTNTYSWNAGDQLAGVTKSGQTLPSFTYDAFGRRQKKTLGATVTSYLYDGANTVQELTGASVTANMLTGLGIDELFQRAEGATTRTFLSDPLGGTLALADSAGTVQTSYTYAPYGETTVNGTASNNTSDFTGRENDTDGLYFYRARYYHPVFSRFVSEDPAEYSGGDSNLHGYAHDSPTNFNDPTGRFLPGAIVRAVVDIQGFVLSGRKSAKPAAPSTVDSVYWAGGNFNFNIAAFDEYGTISIAVVGWTPSGSGGLTITGGYGRTTTSTASVSLTTGPIFTNARDIDDLCCPFAQVGASSQVLGGRIPIVVGWDHAWAGNVVVDNPQVGVGVGREAHVAATNTAVWRFPWR